DELVLLLRLGERLGAPGKPIDRVVRVLEQVRARLARKPVGLLRFGIFRRQVVCGESGREGQAEGQRRGQASKAAGHDGSSHRQLLVADLDVPCYSAVSLTVERRRQVFSSQAWNVTDSPSGEVSPLARRTFALIVTVPS